VYRLLTSETKEHWVSYHGYLNFSWYLSGTSTYRLWPGSHTMQDHTMA